MICDLNQSIESQVISPEDHIPLMEMRYTKQILEECVGGMDGLDWFNAEVSAMDMERDLEMGHSLRIKFKDHVNPYTTSQVTDVAYKEGQECPKVLDLGCEPVCISTTQSWTTCDVEWDKKYDFGATWCVTNERFTYGDLEAQFQENLRNNAMLMALDAWNYFVCEAVANPVATQHPLYEACFPTHYFEAGLAQTDAIGLFKKVVAYLKTKCPGAEYGIFAHPLFEQDMTECDALCPFDQTGHQLPVSQTDTLVNGGWKAMAVKPWGQSVFIAPDSIDLYNEDGTNRHPLLSEDGSKYYVLFTTRRSYFHGQTVYHKPIYYAANCDNGYASWSGSYMTFHKILRPNEVFVLAFPVDCN